MTQPPQIRIVLVDDHPLFLHGMALTLSAEGDLAVVGQGTSAADAVALAAAHGPDILLLDLDIPGGGIGAISAVHEASPATRVVMLTASASEDAIAAALRAGAEGYVLKELSSRELSSVIRSVAAGRRYVAPELAAQMLTDLLGGEPPTPPVDPQQSALFSERERHILHMVALGALNREISDRLQISEKTVKANLTSIFQKLGVRNRVEAAMAVRDRAIQTEPPG